MKFLFMIRKLEKSFLRYLLSTMKTTITAPTITSKTTIATTPIATLTATTATTTTTTINSPITRRKQAATHASKRSSKPHSSYLWHLIQPVVVLPETLSDATPKKHGNT